MLQLELLSDHTLAFPHYIISFHFKAPLTFSILLTLIIIFLPIHQVLAVSSRSWLSYWYQSRFHLTPLSYELLEYASGFSSEQCPEGIVAIAANTLRILALEKLGAVFNQVSEIH